MIKLTEAAAREVLSIIEKGRAQQPDGRKEGSEVYLRVSVKGGGCGGFSYGMDLTDSVAENDERWQERGVEVICDPKSHLYLNGTTIDYVEETMQKRFVFDNPNAAGGCGCGSSFST